MTTDAAVIQEAQTHALGAKGIVTMLQDVNVVTTDDIEQAGAILEDVKDRYKVLKKRLDEITKPLNQALKSTRGLFAPALNGLAEAESILKTKIGAAKTAIEQRRLDAAQAARRALAEGNAVIAASIEIERPPQDAAGVQFRKVWTFEVVEPERVPRDFMSIDEQKIRAFVSMHKDGAQIPGVRIFQKDVVVSR
ncbi:MAG: hypothetical protein HC882_00885 [Acidobacteria bacterium]|nr:hypothetical protein [Acidobacteriota bacterium]